MRAYIWYLEPDEVRALAKIPAGGLFVFTAGNGAPLSRMAVLRMIERAGVKAGLPFKIHPHMLRHACGYALANRGMDTKRLQHYPGHRSISNTVRYTAMSPEPFKHVWRKQGGGLV